MAHEVFEVVPLHIVGEIADVDAALLLRVLAHVAHDLLFVGCWAVTSGVPSGLVVAVGGRTIAAPVVVTAAGTGAVAVVVAAGAARAVALCGLVSTFSLMIPNMESGLDAWLALGPAGATP